MMSNKVIKETIKGGIVLLVILRFNKLFKGQNKKASRAPRNIDRAIGFMIRNETITNRIIRMIGI